MTSHYFVSHSDPVSFARDRAWLRSDTTPLSDDQMLRVAPSIFAEAAHDSRSARYAYIPTSDVLQGLRREGFQPFMVAQTRVRDEGRREFTKHMIRMRHVTQEVAPDANEIVLVNSHDGSSAYRLISGTYRLVCRNGMVCFSQDRDLKVPHKGNVSDRVVAGAFEVLDGFTRIVEEREGMQALTLNDGERAAFARAAISLKYDTETAPAPITESQVLAPRRVEDRPNDLWTVTNRIQESLIRGGLEARTATGRRTRTRAVEGIDNNIKLNRALWILANEMRKLRE